MWRNLGDAVPRRDPDATAVIDLGADNPPRHYGEFDARCAMRRRPAGAPLERRLVAAPLYHMNALAVSQAALAQGGAVILLPGFTPASYVAAASAHRATTLTSVPTMLAMILREPKLLACHGLSSVRTVRMGSVPVSQTLLDAVRRAFPQAAVGNAYGTTAAGPIVPYASKTPPPIPSSRPSSPRRRS